MTECTGFNVLRDGVSIGTVEVTDATEYTFSDINVDKITNSSKTKGTVRVYKLSKKTAKTVTIPESVKIDGYTFKVTVIEKSAFASAKKLSKVVIGKNVTMIGKDAFKDCKNLKTIQVKSAVLKSVGANALKNINAKAKIKVPTAKKKVYTKLFKNKGQKKTVKITK